MLGALLATILFSLSVVSATRTTRLIGGTEANFWRLSFATFFLALYAHSFGGGLRGDSFPIFILSGVLGFGLGDLALFQVLPRLGSRLSILLVHCLAAPFAALTEWLWLGTTLSVPQIACGVVILSGVALALAPDDHPHIERKSFFIGILWGAVAAIGQGGGAVLSRKAFEMGGADGPNGITAAYQRILGGVILSGLCLLIVKRRHLFSSKTVAIEDKTPTLMPRDKWRTIAPWLIFNALCGPTLGVSCYQWALKTTATGVVLPIVALTPLAVIPLAAWLENEKPTRRSLLGGAVAVAGAVALKWVG